jgi:thiamine biosynthesis protein ThiS
MRSGGPVPLDSLPFAPQRSQAFSQAARVKITYNGQDHEVPEGLTVARFLELFALPSRGIAVELNLEVVPRAQHPQRTLSAGDRLEVVTLVGGG